MSAHPSQRLVVVSNRLPVQANLDGGRRVKLQPGGGGLVSAMEAVLRRATGVWVGWPGEGGSASLGAMTHDFPYEIHPVDLTREEVEAYYDGFANRTLWPLFHDLVGRTIFDERWWKIYGQVNRKFAEAVAESAAPGALVFLQDYHLCRAAFHLKALRPDLSTVLFWHIPWPNPEIFRILPWKKEILEGLLANDILGFHLKYHAENFLETVDLELESRIDWERLRVERGERVTRIINRQSPAPPLSNSRTVGYAQGESRSRRYLRWTPFVAFARVALETKSGSVRA